MAILERLESLVGGEHRLGDFARELKYVVHDLHPGGVGAHLITCSDETEYEVVDVFQRGVAQELLPRLKFGTRTAFRTANLGAQYQWGASPLAEEHFATPDSAGTFKLMIIKVNAHVGVTPSAQGPVYGTYQRYGETSTCCGALHSLLTGSTLPAVRDLREAFASEGLDRVSLLRDEDMIPAQVRPLFAAICNARLQARRAVLDLQDHRPQTPTLYAVLASVTLNRHETDTELFCGVYTVDSRTGVSHDRYLGLGDDPSGFRIARPQAPLKVTDEQAGTIRATRDHRRLVLEQFRARLPAPPRKDPRLTDLLREVRSDKPFEPGYRKALLKSALFFLAETNPVTAAVTLFAQGAIELHHAHRLHRIVGEVENDAAAVDLLADLQEQVDHLPPEKAQAVLELLLRADSGLVAH